VTEQDVMLKSAQMTIDPPVSHAQLLRMIEENADRLRKQGELEKTLRWKIREWWETHRPHVVFGRYWENY